jgi:hypothetical protein
MNRRVRAKRIRSKCGRDLRLLDGGMRDGDPTKRRNASDVGPLERRQFVPRDELLAAFKGAPSIDYEELRADIDAYVDQDPTPRYWVD